MAWSFSESENPVKRGKLTIAEYAKSEVIILKLKAMGVDFAQGYVACLLKPLFGTTAVSGDLFTVLDIT